MTEKRAAILVVDDERMNIQILNNALCDEYNILAAMTGEQAIKAVFESLPSLILLDIVLPDMSGHDVCRTLKSNELTKHIPIIFITAQSGSDDELIGLELGAADYFRKPFVLPLIKVRIRNQIELVHKTAELERLVWIDGLTGIPNRRRFDQRYVDACNYAKRNKRRISILLLDIDFFKQYNDYYGHVKGDEVLKTVALTLQQSASRPFDLVARYGGEEFVILLTDSSESEGVRLAEKVRQKIEELAIPHIKSRIHKSLTISIGVTTSLIEEAEFDDEKLLEVADLCLYEAKALGRNTVVSGNFGPETAN